MFQLMNWDFFWGGGGVLGGECMGSVTLVFSVSVVEPVYSVTMTASWLGSV
jgi:hypothetical protein